MTTNEREKKVMDWIKSNFDLSAIKVVNFNALPYGKRIIDCNNDEMAVFYDFFSGEVRYFFPER